MNEPELIDIDWQLFRADGDWHDIGHGIEVMAYPYMQVGAFYIRAAEKPPTLHHSIEMGVVKEGNGVLPAILAIIAVAFGVSWLAVYL